MQAQSTFYSALTRGQNREWEIGIPIFFPREWEQTRRNSGTGISTQAFERIGTDNFGKIPAQHKVCVDYRVRYGLFWATTIVIFGQIFGCMCL